MKRHKLIHELNQEIKQIYKEENLQSLSDYLKINNRESLLTRYSEITTKAILEYNSKTNFNKILDDLFLCSDEILYFTAQLFLYQPFLNNPLTDKYSKHGKIVFPNIQNLEAKRYYMFADIISEKFYNYWDRIGDIIASFFPKLFKPNSRIYFAIVIDRIKNEFSTIEDFKCLLKYRNNDYKTLGKIRNNIVHQTTTATRDKYDYISEHKNWAEVVLWNKERQNIANEYKKYSFSALEGFRHTLSFLETI